ncbi:DUF2341 domain-containing protein [Flammeovirga aprica]|uniref:DUF2341 domain-containing protein n=1 Tax=Flammeovirga aprica JL-4 TaxID=694437 RepID=A0A7X9RY54_9BACT|nr:DUF2341 domain-containing protein [Flammeovirga aprica]NME70881.1 DUF2341 domain-containing protein [Flammeovirga aprica JL-4]
MRSLIVLLLFSVNLFGQTCFTNYTNLQKIEIKNAGTIINDYQLKITINSEELISQDMMSSDGSDIRFKDQYGNILSYWIEDGSINTNQTNIWLRVPKIENGSNPIYFYYGNPHAVAQSSGENTFLYFDDFNLSFLNQEKWDTSCATSDANFHFNNGKIVIEGGSDNQPSNLSILQSKQSVNIPCTLEAKVDGISLTGESVFGFKSKYQEGLVIGANAETSSGFIKRYTDDECLTEDINSSGRSVVGDNVWKLTFDGRQASGNIGESLLSNLSSTSTISSSSILLGSTKGNAKVIVDYIFARSEEVEGITIVYNQAKSLVSEIVGNLEYCQGQNIQVSVPQIDGASYQWKFNSNIIVGNSNQLNIANCNLNHAGNYSLEITLEDNCIITKDISLSVSSLTDSGVLTGSNSICSVDMTKYQLELNNYVGEIKYWEYSETGDAPWIKIDNQSAIQEYKGLKKTQYFRVFVESNSCEGSYSNIQTVEVSPIAIGGDILEVSSQCPDENSGTLNLINYQGDILRWEKSLDNITFSPIPNVTNTLSFTDLQKSTYYRVVVENGACGSVYSSVREVNVESSPITEFDATEVCEGDPTVFTPDLISNDYTYQWDFGNGAFSSLNKPIHLYAKAGLYKVQLTLTSKNGCSYSTVQDVIVKTVPKVSFNVGEVCVNESTNFSNTTFYDGTSTLSYSWDFGDGQTSIEENPSHTYSTPGVYQVSVSVTTDDGCSAVVTKNVESFPVPEIDFIVENSCFGTPLIIKNLSSVQDGTVSYKWYLNDALGSVSTSFDPVFNTIPSGEYEIVLEATSTKGCVKTMKKLINVYPLPTADFVNTEVCIGSVTSFTNQSSIDQNIFTTSLHYSWDFGDGSVSIEENPTHKYEASGLYKAKLQITSTEGCVDVFEKYVRVWDTPVSAFKQENVCLGNPMLFTNQSNTSSGKLTYLWDFGDTNTSTSLNPTHNYAASGKYTVILEVTNSSGCKDSYQQEVIVNDQPVSDFTFSNVCIGSEIEFINESFALVSGVKTDTPSSFSYEWNFGDGTISREKDPHHLYKKSGSYTVELIIKSDEGCESSSKKVVNIYPEPTVDFTFTESCYGVATQFYNNSAIQSGTLTYSWDFGDGVTSSDKNPIHTYLSPGNYDVKLVVQSEFGCEKELFKEVTVNPLPVLDFIAQPVCDGQEMVFENLSTISNEGEITSYQWNFGDGTNSIDSAPRKLYTKAGKYTVTLKATSDQGCFEVFSKEVVVKEIPVPDFEVKNVCFGEAHQFTNTSWNIEGTATYLWDFGDGKTSTEENPSNTYVGTGSYEVSLTVTSEGGCTTVQRKMIESYPIPVIDFTVVNSCVGASLIIKNLSKVKDETISYKWYLNDALNSTSTSFDPSFNDVPSGEYKVTLEAVSSYGCTEKLTKTIQIYPKPIVEFTNSEVCIGNPTLFTNQSSIDQSIFTTTLNYSWDFGDGSVSSLENPVHEYEASGLYQVKLQVTSAEGCVSSFEKYVRVWDTPVAAFTQENVCFGQTMIFTNQSNTSSGQLSYVWDFGDGSSSTSLNPTHQYSSTGRYTVSLEVTNSSDCKDIYQQEVVVNDQPVSSFSFTNICIGNKMAFINESYAEINGEKIYTPSSFSYEWDFGDGTTSLEKDPQHLYTESGAYTVKLITKNNEGCELSSQYVVNVYPEPKVDFTFTQPCFGEATQFSNNSTIQTGVMSYLWDFGDGITSTDLSPNHIYSSPGAYTVKLVVQSEYGCVAEVDREVNVNPLPVLDFTALPVCDGQEMIFENQSSISKDGKIITYQWNFGDGTNSIDVSPRKTYLNTGKYTVVLKATSDQGCVEVFSKVVEVKEVPVPDFDVVNVCFGEAHQFNNISWNIDGTAAYLWDFGDGKTSTLKSPEHAYDIPGEYSVQLKVIANEGCFDIIEKPVITYGLPKVIISDEIEISQGFSTQLTATGGVNYLWSPATGLNNANISNPEASPKETTTYKVRVTDKYGCITEDEVTVYVKDDFRLFPMNVVTPDGNGKNDTWIVENIERYPEAKVQIFNRLGENIYTTTNYKNDWGAVQGTDILPDGSYYYIITSENFPKVYKGAITVLRNSNNYSSPQF